MSQFKNSLFLDTSTHINRHWADEQIQRKIRADLFKKRLLGSIYVEHQYSYIILKNLALIYNICIKFQNKDEAKERIEKLRQKTILDDLPYRIVIRYFKQYNTIKPILRRLKRLIEKDWENYFYAGLTKPLCDLTNCTRGRKRLEKNRNYYLPPSYNCFSICQIEVFWQSKKKDLIQLSQLDITKFNKNNDPKGTMTEIQKVATLILNGKSPRGKFCQAISDVIISIEARDSYPGTSIHTTDHDFTHLSLFLNVPVRYFNISAP